MPFAKLFNPDQPRVPSGSGKPSGQWTKPGAGGGGGGSPGDGGGDGASPAADLGGIDSIDFVTPIDFSPDKFGWHDYTAGPNLVCPAELQCTKEEMADLMSRFGVPGRDPSKPIEDGQMYAVFDPRTGLFAGWIRTTVTDDGLTITNTTNALHILYDGKIVRQAVQAEDGSWYVTTRGTGNNWIPGMNLMNAWQGRKIFDYMDQKLRDYVQGRHGQKNTSQA